METLSLHPCCYLCSKIYDKKSCPLCETYDAAADYGSGKQFETVAKFKVVCSDFTLNSNFEPVPNSYSELPGFDITYPY